MLLNGKTICTCNKLYSVFCEYLIHATIKGNPPKHTRASGNATEIGDDSRRAAAAGGGELDGWSLLLLRGGAGV